MGRTIIMKKAIPESVQCFALHNISLPSSPSAIIHRHHEMGPEQVLDDAAPEVEVSATDSGFIKIAPRPTGTAHIVSLTQSRAAITKQKYRNRPGVRARENARRRENYKRQNEVPNETVCAELTETNTRVAKIGRIDGVLHRYVQDTHVVVRDVFTQFVTGKVPREASTKLVRVRNGTMEFVQSSQ